MTHSLEKAVNSVDIQRQGGWTIREASDIYDKRKEAFRRWVDVLALD